MPARVVSSLLVLLVLVACAASDPQRQAVAQNPTDLICTREYPVGSNIPVTKCRTVDQIEAEKRAADSTMESTRRVGNVGGRPTQ